MNFSSTLFENPTPSPRPTDETVGKVDLPPEVLLQATETVGQVDPPPSVPPQADETIHMEPPPMAPQHTTDTISMVESIPTAPPHTAETVSMTPPPPAMLSQVAETVPMTDQPLTVSRQATEAISMTDHPLLATPETLDNALYLSSQLWQGYWHEWLVWLLNNLGYMLAAVLCLFIPYFIFQSWRLRWQLAGFIKQLKTLKKISDGPMRDLEGISHQAEAAGRLAHPWEEYRHTLHPQHQVNHLGQKRLVQWRASALAETFFTEQTLVNTPLKTEFYKHLPGILTGLGIIGTFSGLILGLARFSTEQATMRTSLAELIKTVGDAFQVSAAAIMLAILFTFIEKFTLTACYRQVEKLCQIIDSFFPAGAGEEYLLRLIQSSEHNMVQAAHLKDALVADLREIFSDSAVQQEKRSDEHIQKMVQAFPQVFADTMREPMDRIAHSVQLASSTQGAIVEQALTKVLASFTEEMQDLLGGQLREVNDVLTKTTKAMRADIVRYGRQAAKSDYRAQQTSSKLLKGLTEQVAILATQVAESAESIQSSTEALSTRSAESAGRMDRSATTLLKASDQLAVASQQVGATMQAMDHLSHAMQSTADSLSGSSADVQKMSDDYKSTTKAFRVIVSEFKEVIKTARKEASLSTTLVGQLQDSAKKLSTIQQAANHYLDSVTHVLEKSHESFANSMMETLRAGNAQFHTELSTAVGYLQSAIMDLGDLLDSVRDKGA